MSNMERSNYPFMGRCPTTIGLNVLLLLGKRLFDDLANQHLCEFGGLFRRYAELLSLVRRLPANVRLDRDTFATEFVFQIHKGEFALTFFAYGHDGSFRYARHMTSGYIVHIPIVLSIPSYEAQIML